MEQDKEETPVIFRMLRKKNGGCVIALFPTIPGTYDAGTCTDYVHVGQHGSADPHVIINMSRAATPAEYADLKKELEGIGYRPRVYQRLQRSFYEARRKELDAIKRVPA